MKDIVTYDEILEFAIHREQEANNFFLALAQCTENPNIQRVFRDFAAEELEHKAKLEMELINKGRTVKSAQEKQDINISDYIISDGPTPPLEMDYVDVLMLGVAKEDASFRLYVDMAGLATDSESKDMFLALAEEEIQHKLRFKNELDNLSQR